MSPSFLASTCGQQWMSTKISFHYPYQMKTVWAFWTLKNVSENTLHAVLTIKISLVYWESRDLGCYLQQPSRSSTSLLNSGPPNGPPCLLPAFSHPGQLPRFQVKAGTRFTFESVVITQNLCAKGMSPEMFSRYSYKISKYVMYIKILLLMIVIKLKAGVKFWKIL